MLKITVMETETEIRWIVQGRLVGPWAAELRLAWRNARHESDTRKCIVELNDVTFIDQNGKAVLQEIMSQNPEFVTSSIYTKQILENLRKELERKSHKEGQGK